MQPLDSGSGLQGTGAQKRAAVTSMLTLSMGCVKRFSFSPDVRSTRKRPLYLVLVLRTALLTVLPTIRVLHTVAIAFIALQAVGSARNSGMDALTRGTPK